MNPFKSIVPILFFVFTTENIIAQQFTDGLLWASVSQDSARVVADSTSSSASLNQVFNTYNVYSYKQIMSFAKTSALRNVYEIKCNCDESDLKNELVTNFSSCFSNVEQRPEPIALYDPADDMWQNHSTDWLWDLVKIQADLAWDITKGNPNLKIAVVDDGIDLIHPDLVGKIDPAYDFYTGNAPPVQSHGTSVTTILAGETVDQGQTPNGTMASIGYNCKMMFAGFSGGAQACLYASTTLGAKIISLSWYNGCSSNSTDLLIEQEILDNGTAIIRAAGNGSGNCSGGRLYPFSGYEDDRTIVVSSTDYDDNHEDINPGGGGFSNSHYAEVDICAPGYALMGGTSTNGGTNLWPYYGSWGGTSQSTPIVSGVAALMCSCNPSLTPSEIQTIIMQTADPITDEANYSGLVGAGRINAYHAVQSACCPYDLTLSGTVTQDKNKKVQHDITSTEVINTSLNVTYTAGNGILLQSGFQVASGSVFYGNIGPCQY